MFARQPFAVKFIDKSKSEMTGIAGAVQVPSMHTGAHGEVHVRFDKSNSQGDKGIPGWQKGPTSAIRTAVKKGDEGGWVGGLRVGSEFFLLQNEVLILRHLQHRSIPRFCSSLDSMICA